MSAKRFLRRLTSAALLAYQRLPYHRGKWRVVDAVCRAGGLDRRPPPPTEASRSGFRWHLNPGSYIDRTIYYLGRWEDLDTAAAMRSCPTGGVAVDAGANIGWYSLHMARAVGPTGEVHAFEPVAVERERLEKNIALNGLSWIHVHPVALSDRAGHTSMSPVGDAGTTALGEGGEIVRTISLDDLRLPRLDFIKLDIEGAELLFLHGARETLARLHPTILIELEAENLQRFGATPDDIVAELKALGYQLEPTGSRSGRNVLAVWRPE